MQGAWAEAKHKENIKLAVYIYMYAHGQRRRHSRMARCMYDHHQLLSQKVSQDTENPAAPA